MQITKQNLVPLSPSYSANKEKEYSQNHTVEEQWVVVKIVAEDTVRMIQKNKIVTPSIGNTRLKNVIFFPEKINFDIKTLAIISLTLHHFNRIYQKENQKNSILYENYLKENSNVIKIIDLFFKDSNNQTIISSLPDQLKPD